MLLLLRQVLKWTAEYEVGGITYKTYAYTTVYSPYDKPATSAVRVYNSRGVECDLQQIAWVSGLTGCNTNGNRTINTNSFKPIKGVLTKPKTTADTARNHISPVLREPLTMKTEMPMMLIRARRRSLRRDSLYSIQQGFQIFSMFRTLKSVI